jgi:hypothetical protein
MAQIRTLRTGQVTVFMALGAGVGNWNDPDTNLPGGASPVQNELEYEPQVVVVERIANFVAPVNQGVLTVVATAQGVTVTSSQALDSASIRCTAYCRASEMGG